MSCDLLVVEEVTAVMKSVSAVIKVNATEARSRVLLSHGYNLYGAQNWEMSPVPWRGYAFAQGFYTHRQTHTHELQNTVLSHSFSLMVRVFFCSGWRSTIRKDQCVKNNRSRESAVFFTLCLNLVSGFLEEL